ncbi:uncharacterized protein B0H64DRAFT_90781 [Chaetomium fimeti]|jgi:hypothetical protein|uniref:Uncharacterized protein n=1 Tax=Chaetomium fimeti TaxID=1854472 RepID=A0AAE0LVI4_9PEZI|nr:hypothetical protein B0H64DRAFT_90781 [Chaetomium fimeti]
MEHSAFPRAPPATGHVTTTNVRLQPSNSTAGHQSHFGRTRDPHGLPPPDASSSDNVGPSPAFHASGFNGFANSYTGPPSGSVVSAATLSHTLDEIKPVPATEPEHHEHDISGGAFGLLGQTNAHRDSGTDTIGTLLPPLSQFGILSQNSVANRAVTEVPSDRNTNLVRTDSAHGSGSLGVSGDGQLPANIVENPPNLDLWRQKLFELEKPLILTNEE